MANQLLVSISTAEVALAEWRGRGFRDIATFPNDESGLAAFAQALERVRRVPVQIIVDAVEEDYRYETLPHAYGRDRNELVARKMRQLYRGTPYCAAVPRGRDAAGKRRDDRYLFLALTNPETIAPWVRTIEGAGLPVAGVYLLPMAGEVLIERLGIAQANLLAVTQVSTGLRLTFFRDRQLRLSRLVRVDAPGMPPTAVLAEEINNTRFYLNSLRLIGLDEPLTVVMVDARDELAEAAAALTRENPSLECQRIGRDELSKKLGLSAAALNSGRAALILHTVGLKTPAGNLAPAVVTAGFKEHQVRRGLYAAAAVAAVGAILWAVVNTGLTLDASFDVDRKRAETAQQQAAYVEATRQFPAAPTSSENIQRAVVIARELIKTLRSPEPFLALVSTALDTNPTVLLREIEWKYGITPIESGASRGGKPATEAPGGAAVPRQSGLISGEIRPFRGDYRAAIETINRFAQTLAKDPAIEEVRITQLPLNVSPDLALAGNTVDARDQAPTAAQFKLLILLRASAR